MFSGGHLTGKPSDCCDDSDEWQGLQVFLGSFSQVSLATYMSLVVRKPVYGVSDQVPHKPGCTATQDG